MAKFCSLLALLAKRVVLVTTSRFLDIQNGLEKKRRSRERKVRKREAQAGRDRVKLHTTDKDSSSINTQTHKDVT